MNLSNPVPPHILLHQIHHLETSPSSISISHLTQTIIHLDLIQHANQDAIQAHYSHAPIPNPALRRRPQSPCYLALLLRHNNSMINSISVAVHQFWAQFLSECEQAQVISCDSVHGHLSSGLASICRPSVLAHTSISTIDGDINPDLLPILFSRSNLPPTHLKQRFIQLCYIAEYDEYVAARVIGVLARVLGPDLNGLGQYIRGVQRVDERRCARIAALIVAGRMDSFIINQLIEFLLGQHVHVDPDLVSELFLHPWTAPFAMEIVTAPHFVIGRDFREQIFAAFQPLPNSGVRWPQCCSWRHDRDHVWSQICPLASEVVHAQRRMLQYDPNLGDLIAKHILELLTDHVSQSDMASAVVQTLPQLLQISLFRDQFWFVAAQIIKMVDNEALIEAMMTIISCLSQIGCHPTDDYIDATLQRLLGSRGVLFGHIAEHIYELTERYESVTLHCLTHTELSSDLISLLANASDSLVVANAATLLGALIQDVVSKRVFVDRQALRRIARANFVPVCCKRVIESSSSDDIELVRAVLGCLYISVHLAEVEITSNMFCKSGSGPPLLLQVLSACEQAPYCTDPQIIANLRQLLIAACRNVESRFAVTFSRSADVSRHLLVLLGHMSAPPDVSDLDFLKNLMGIETINDHIRNLPGFKQWLLSFNHSQHDPNLHQVLSYFLQHVQTYTR